MKLTVRIIVIILLLFNGIGAFFGGYNLISDPTGGSLQMPLSFLEESPFTSYLIPGIVLFLVNGVFSFVALYALWKMYPKAYLLVMIQGVLLSGWIVVQMILLQVFYPPLHLSFLLIGLSLLGGGYYQLKSKSL